MVASLLEPPCLRITNYWLDIRLSSYQVPLIVNNGYKRGRGGRDHRFKTPFWCLCYATFVVVAVLGLRYRLESV